jgi:hypothetical protein
MVSTLVSSARRAELPLLDESSEPALGAPACGLRGSRDLFDGSTVGMLGDRCQHGRVEGRIWGPRHCANRAAPELIAPEYSSFLSISYLYYGATSSMRHNSLCEVRQ